MVKKGDVRQDVQLCVNTIIYCHLLLTDIWMRSEHFSCCQVDISCTVISTLKLLSFGFQTCVALQEEVTIGYEHNIWIDNN